MAKITGRFNMRMPEAVPFFVEGKDAKAVYDSLKKLKTGTMGYDAKSQTFYGSTPIVAARIDTLVRPLGIRVANLRDLSRPEVMSMIKDKHYTDAPILVARSATDTHAPNQPILDRLIEEVEKREGKVEFPFMVSGFDSYPLPSQLNGYKIGIKPRDDFEIVHDERLGFEYHGKTFSDVDEQGLPNFARGGRTWYCRDNGLSRLCLNWNLGIYSSNEYLANSNGYGRVVLVSGRATAAKLSISLQRQLKANFERLQLRVKQEYDTKNGRLKALGEELGFN